MALTSLLAEVLFIGHSLVGPTLPGMVETGLAAMAAPAPVTAHVINGAPLKWQWEHSAEAEGVDGRAEIARGLVSDLVLTEAQPIADHLKWSDSAAFVALWGDAARAVNPQARVWLYESWPAMAPGGAAAVAEWRAQIRSDLPLWQEAAADHARIIPAGQAMAALSEAIDAGIVPGITSTRALFSDDQHPNGKGYYLVAMVQLASLTGRSPQGLSERLFRIWPDRASVMTKEQALVFQKIAWETVQSFETAEAARLAQRQAAPAADTVSEPAAEAGAEAAAEAAAAARSEADAGTHAAAAEAEVAVVSDDPVAAAPAPSDPAPADMPDSPALADEPATAPASAPAAEVAAADTAITPAQPEVAAATAPPAVFDPILNPNLAFGLAGVNDWSVQQPFLDVMKTARPWLGHLPGQWGGWGEQELRAAGALDAEGWPRLIPEAVTGIATLVLTDLPSDAGAVAGRYLLRYDGKGELRVEGRAEDIAETPGEIRFTYHPGPGSVVLTLLDTDPQDPLRHIRLVREDRAALLDEGEIFNPDWLDRLAGIRMFRAMDWMATNDSTLAAAADRPRISDYSWARQGVPIEVIMALANELRADPWITVPHLAENQLVREIGAVAAERLDPELRLWAEYSNEVWNWQFAQASWSEAQAQSRWGQQHGWVQFYALRAAEVMAVLAEELPPARLVRVIGTQTGWLGLEEQILDAPLVQAEGKPAPAASFDAYAVAGYFAGGLGSDEKRAAVKGWIAESRAAAAVAAQNAGLSGDAASAYALQHGYDLAVTKAAAELRNGATTGAREDSLAWLADTVLPHHAAVAKAHGLQLVMYEGGSHVVAMGAGVDDAELTDFFTRLNYTPEMGALYQELMQGWAKVTDAPFNAFVDVYVPGKWGSWGALRHLWDDNPRWQALAQGCAAC